jgi:hypothetical protein
MEAEIQVKPSQRLWFSVSDLIWVTAAFAVALVFVTGMFPTIRYFPERPQSIIGGLIGTLIVLVISDRLVMSKSIWIQIVALVSIAFMTIFIVNLTSWFLITWLVGGFVCAVVLRESKRSGANRLRAVAVWLIAVTLAGDLLTYFYPSRRVASLLEARAAYPIVDLTPRLARYRTSTIETGPAKVNEPEITHPISDSKLTENLYYFYHPDQKNTRGRIRDLQNIHSHEYEAFVHSLGFGVFRMPYLGRWRVDTPELAEIPFDAPVLDEKKIRYEHNSIRLFYTLNERNEFDFSSEVNSLPQLLERSYLDFLNPLTFGWMPDFKQAVGFDPHAFRFPLPSIRVDKRRFSIQRLELIGILVDESPRVYVLHHLPRMDQISSDDIQKRDLDEFERNSLRRLFDGEDLVVEESEHQIKMLGALRAIDQCAQCHDSQSGDLLGEFSYDLRARK